MRRGEIAKNEVDEFERKTRLHVEKCRVTFSNICSHSLRAIDVEKCRLCEWLQGELWPQHSSRNARCHTLLFLT